MTSDFQSKAKELTLVVYKLGRHSGTNLAAILCDASPEINSGLDTERDFLVAAAKFYANDIAAIRASMPPESYKSALEAARRAWNASS